MRSTLAHLLALGALGAHGHAAPELGYVPPLAAEAKAAPDKTPSEIKNEESEARRVKHSVMLGSHEFASLEAVAATIIEQYENGEITADEFVIDFHLLVPKNSGKFQIPDILKWTERHPDSYAAWYVLARQYLHVAEEARGSKWARDTSEEQFAEMDKYARLARDAAEKSLDLYEKPLPSYRVLVPVFKYIQEDLATSEAHSASLLCTIVRMLSTAAYEAFCVDKKELQEAEAVGATERTSLDYLREAMALDPNSTVLFVQYIVGHTPRWGGSYEHLESVVQEAERSGMSDKNVSELRAELVYQHAWDAESIELDHPRAAALFRKSFELFANPESTHLLIRAAQQARKAGDLDLSIQLYSEAIDLDDTLHEAFFYRGILYREKGDFSRSFADQIESAKLGDMYAQNNIGYAYLTGDHGFPVDLHEAKAWLTLSANQGFDHARQKLPVVEQKLAEQDR